MMIWKNDTGLPFTEIRRACCAAGGKTSESRKTWRIKEQMETDRHNKKGLGSSKGGQGLVTSRETEQPGSSKEGRACWQPRHQFHSAPLKLLRNWKNERNNNLEEEVARGPETRGNVNEPPRSSYSHCYFTDGETEIGGGRVA